MMRRNVTLWVIQGLLAALFLFAGSMKLILPIEAMAGPVALPGAFLRFIGVVEVLGAVGLVLPWLLRIRPELTPLAGAGLVADHGRRDRDHHDGRRVGRRAGAVRRRACSPRQSSLRPLARRPALQGARQS